MNFSHFVRTDWFYRTIYRFCFVVLAQLPNPLRVLSKTQPRLDDEYTCGRLNRLTDHYFGYWLLAMGYWLLAMGWSMRRAAIRAFRL